MKNEELTEAKRIFNTITANGMREMTESRYLQAVQEFMEWQAKNLHKPLVSEQYYMKNKEIKYLAYHKPTKKMYYFDVFWGNKQNIGNGYIPMLPVGEKLIRHLTNQDNRIAIDPSDCEIFEEKREEL